MLRTDLIDLVNSGTAWAFVGSGVSVDAGYPIWEDLVNGALGATPEASRERIANDPQFKSALRDARYEACFSVIEKFTDRDHLEKVVKAQLAEKRERAQIASIIAEWPFAAYATSNYDTLLESILNERLDSSWTPVGNTSSEIPKVSGDARDLVWHVHGSVALEEERSRLILTEQDYDDLYLEGSTLERQLRGLLTQKRFIFVGFGFNDPELRRLLKIVAKYTTPARPILAFLARAPSSEGEPGQQLDLLEQYNVDVIPYPLVDGTHSALSDILDTHSALVLGRSLRFGQQTRPCPSYDPETTGLLVYNELALSGKSPVADDALGALVRARVLSLLRHRGPVTIAELTEDLHERSRQLQQPLPATAQAKTTRDSAPHSIANAVADLEEQGLIESIDGGLGPAVHLTPVGDRLTDNHAAVARLMGEQFTASLQSRARSAGAHLAENSQLQVASAAESFLKECVTKRALGVAMAWHSTNVDFRSYHVVALLQALPSYAQQLGNIGEAKVLIHVIRSILSESKDIELKYLGSLMQAHFGLCLMGLDPGAVAARTRELSRTLFLLDSTTLIPLLGRSSAGHGAAKQLIDQIRRVGAAVATTKLLALEVAEHARWALKELGETRTLGTLQALAAATGRAGARENVFIDGCVAEAAAGHPTDFDRYLDSVCGVSTGHLASDEVFEGAIRKNGVACLSFSEWDGFSDELWPLRDELQAEIGERRRANKTYHHDRQVRAEAEALLAVRYLRAGTFGLADQRFVDGYFLSHSRVIDEVVRDRPVTMRPQAVHQWLSTLTNCGPDELGVIVNCILGELSERGMSIVNEGHIRAVFGPLIDGSRARLQEERERHRDLIAERYGERQASAFGDVSPLDIPFVAESYFAQKSRDLEAALRAAQAKASLDAKERQELQTLRALKKLKEGQTKRKRRKTLARPKKRRRTHKQ